MKKYMLAIFVIFGLLLQGVYAEEEYINRLWVHNMGGNVWKVMHGDFTGNGVPEIVVASGCCGNPGYATVFDVSGAIVWQAKMPYEIRALDIGDINGDGKLEAVAADTNSKIYFISNKVEVTEVFPDSSSVQMIKIADIDGDGKDETITGSSYIRVFKNTKEIANYSTANRISDINVYDLTGDKNLEIITGGLGNNVYVFDSALNLLWTHRSNSVVWGTIPFTYLGNKSVLVLSRGYFVLDKEGNKVFEKPMDDYFITGHDTGNMILLADGKGNLKSYDYSLNELWSFKAEKEIKSISSYKEGNEMIILFGSMDENFYMIKGDGKYIGQAKAGSYVSTVDSFNVKNKRYVVYGSFDDNVYTYYREIKNVPFYGIGTVLAALMYYLYRKRQ
ncbi:MAG: FG-GAP repeat protein [Candidatus Methanofastidiosum methylothiophilum]|uniref:FG-GAP repeat protein n=1 Tax=Candidatus Methanofastidiosum methylothiophilum TaxID=1705564 RepID=A0A150II34_9EURY|nr:MAG: FG-GAP repeat protein [Candidatus Methanofastidiosum methylthiophilus]KYC46860.1 MAG: FG-GAP repeat protein [Candidatus Methanofastidiosum methylthiophilus]KYC49090.1 MAG: FG-GAP repeat protein [Candidatus Methanofastidiosum methylthiophilus]